ncbi:hypothetical protein SODALDRAFT_334231 [Sodiomyces alkalinus F11]|uniref:Uncharacterized protein n=1 Tax=Sodiomyces alkalinus (strain CBS 110278 / VKM F-3762 / F11) TaxID=1314773 RepID=A0A3N2PRN6_SODAK|nr:hypothetical protein SODALDRAFT_334231 [Sodiomyces alkalinus F11]ROT37155.1 hypothetical protein SODALDRAFT_334231 [Sodiomyces alkalinus F11]
MGVVFPTYGDDVLSYLASSATPPHPAGTNRPSSRQLHSPSTSWTNGLMSNRK